MGAPRRKNLIANRRRTDDDGEDEEEGSAVLLPDDVSSVASAPSEVDDDADTEGSDASKVEHGNVNGTKRQNGQKVVMERPKGPDVAVRPKDPTFATSMADTNAMMNGLNLSAKEENQESINFEDAQEHDKETTADAGPALNGKNLPLEHRWGGHEEYRRKRDEDPAFVPNRGGFFMHDHRSSAPGQNGFRPSGRGGRGRGRGGLTGAFPLSPYVTSDAFLRSPLMCCRNGSSSNPADALWAHDLHATVAEPNTKAEPSKPAPTAVPPNAPAQQRLPLPPQQASPPNRSFSCTTQVGSVQVRVFVARMKEPVVIPGMRVNQHTRLPHHRPPLRRDKPVRVSLPDSPPRYIFPAVDRSFIFIPRALRPNQQGFGRARGKGSFGGYGGFPSGRNSLYGGSAYSPSVAMSRRSSLAHEVGRDGLPSPVGSVASRSRGAPMSMGKPVVRLPPAMDAGPHQMPQQPPYISNPPTPIVNLPQPQAYPLPPRPVTQNWASASSLPMHQPRPQKQVSVADIESPAALNFHPPQQQQQLPFHQQVPHGVNGQGYPPESGMISHSRRPSHPSQHGTPLSQIPERAIHAPAFQPYPYQSAPAFYPMQYPPPVYYFPPPTSAGPPGAPIATPPFAPGQPYPFVLPAPPAAAPPEAAAQSGMVAHESNGMVYYYDPTQLPASAEDPSAYQAVPFAPPNAFMVPQPSVLYPPS